MDCNLSYDFGADLMAHRGSLVKKDEVLICCVTNYRNKKAGPIMTLLYQAYEISEMKF
jgi:hypothetical protein